MELGAPRARRLRATVDSCPRSPGLVEGSGGGYRWLSYPGPPARPRLQRRMLTSTATESQLQAPLG